MKRAICGCCVFFWVTFGCLASSSAQDREAEDLELRVEPSQLELQVGDKATLTATVLDKFGKTVEKKVIFYSRSRRDAGVSSSGVVTAHRPGKFIIVALVPKDPEHEARRADAIVRVEIPVTIPKPPVASITISALPDRLYSGTSIRLETEVIDTSETRRPDVKVEFSSSNPQVVGVDRFGNLEFSRTGRATIHAKAGAFSDQMTLSVIENPTHHIELESSHETARTGDVIRFTAKAKDAQGREVVDLPLQFSLSARTDGRIIGAGASAQIDQEGRFVAERSGQYTVISNTGKHLAKKTVEVTPRDVRKNLKVVGHGPVRDRHTSDLWVWEGNDGKDYAITGTWGADGHAYVWDVTDPAKISLIDIVKVDARTVNDVKVSENGAIAVISREGASNRKNGFVILDVSNPSRGVTILSEYDDQLTGGVHNTFLYQNHVFALSAGRRYDIINVTDPAEPFRVGRFELDTPGHGIHDVWVADGVAYSSNWEDGVVAVDVGGGGKGGSIGEPVFLGEYAYPSGWNHAAFPYRSQSTGKFYVFAGDEAFPYDPFDGRKKRPTRAAGWVHVIEWESWDSAREVARYQVPEAGTHNLWVEDDVLYVAYYNGGLRMVDVSGELMGDLYKQGREIAFWVPYDPEGYIANAPFVWGPQPFKGHIFISDWNSGLWALKLEESGPVPETGEPQ